MRALRIAAFVAGGLVVAVVVGGFFHDTGRKKASATTPRQPIHHEAWGDAAPRENSRTLDGNLAFASSSTSAAFPTGGSYRREAEFRLRVQNSIAAEEQLQARAARVQGTLLDLLIEGAEGARSGTVLYKIPADKVNEFVRDVRELGKILNERITARHVTGSGGGETDQREFALVRVHFADEAVSPEVKEGQGLFLTSFEKGAGHFLKGLAVLVEAAGYVLPFALALGLVLAPVLVVVRARRRARMEPSRG